MFTYMIVGFFGLCFLSFLGFVYIAKSDLEELEIRARESGKCPYCGSSLDRYPISDKNKTKIFLTCSSCDFGTWEKDEDNE